MPESDERPVVPDWIGHDVDQLRNMIAKVRDALYAPELNSDRSRLAAILFTIDQDRSVHSETPPWSPVAKPAARVIEIDT